MDHQKWIKQWEAENGPATWAAYIPGEPDDPPGIVQPLRRAAGMSDADWREEKRAVGQDWMIWVDVAMRMIVLINELGLWQRCERPSCRRHRRCTGFTEKGEGVPPCCAAEDRCATVLAALNARDRLTLDLMQPAEDGGSPV